MSRVEPVHRLSLLLTTYDDVVNSGSVFAVGRGGNQRSWLEPAGSEKPLDFPTQYSMGPGVIFVIMVFTLSSDKVHNQFLASPA